MSVNSKRKGAAFERTVAHLFKDEGYDCRRSAQYCGNTGEAADVVGAPGIHIECKAQEKMCLYDWMEQAKRDSNGSDKLPVVIHKKNNCDILVTMRWQDWIQLYREWEAGKNE